MLLFLLHIFISSLSFCPTVHQYDQSHRTSLSCASYGALPHSSAGTDGDRGSSGTPSASLHSSPARHQGNMSEPNLPNELFFCLFFSATNRRAASEKRGVQKLLCTRVPLFCVSGANEQQKQSYIWSGGVCEEFTVTTAARWRRTRCHRSLSLPHWRAGIYVNLAFTMERTTLAARRCRVCMATSKFPSRSSALESLQQVEAAAAAASNRRVPPFSPAAVR